MKCEDILSSLTEDCVNIKLPIILSAMDSTDIDYNQTVLFPMCINAHKNNLNFVIPLFSYLSDWYSK